MIDLRPILYALGALLLIMATAMLVPVATDIMSQNIDWQIFLIAAMFTGVFGGMLLLANSGTASDMNLRQAFILTNLSWVTLPAFAALPFAFSELDLSYTDAFFEAMSGLTTTGSTVISGLDTAPPGILIWRGLLQWIGGIGIIVMTVAILPMLQVGGMQLFKTESFDYGEKILPRATQLSSAIGGLYLSATALCMLLLVIAGMKPFDAMVHAMTSIATGGFSTSDGSVGHFDSGLIHFIIAIFMLLGSLPFVIYLQVLRGRPIALWRDEQVRAFLKLIIGFVAIVTLWLIAFKGFTVAEAFQYGGFNIISVITGTGYATTDYGQWGSFSVSLFFFAMFIGGCAGSTSCGIKIFRYLVLLKSMRSWVNRIFHPNGIFVARYNGHPIEDTVRNSVMAFLILFAALVFVLATLLAATGLDWITAFAGAGTSLANVGPGLGPIIGPSGTFAPLNDMAKWLLSLGMLVGRLEIFTILVLLSPAFWRG